MQHAGIYNKTLALEGKQSELYGSWTNKSFYEMCGLLRSRKATPHLITAITLFLHLIFRFQPNQDYLK